MEVILSSPTAGAPPPPVAGPSEVSVHRSSGLAASGALMQTSLGCVRGEGLPAALSVRGVAAQMSVLDRWADAAGSPRVFRAFVPVAAGSTFSEPGGTNPLAYEEVAGTPSPLSGVYPAPNPNQLQIGLDIPSKGTYIASLSDPDTTVVTEIGPGSERGNAGPDYYKVTRFQAPFKSISGFPGIHAECGAAIVYVHERVDFKGYLIQVRFTSAVMEANRGSFDGDDGRNPGYVVFQRLTVPYNPSLTGWTTEHLDTYNGGDGGTDPQFCVRPFNGGSRRHVLAPGCAPGWTMLYYDAAVETSAGKRNSILKGLDTSFAWTGRGFYENSDYSFSAHRLRHVDPRRYGQSLASVESTTTNRAATLQTQVTQGTATGNSNLGPVGGRAGWYYSVGTWSANETGGQDIEGHAMQAPTTANAAVLRLLAMGSTRRSNHDYYIDRGSRQHLSADHLFTQAPTDANDVATTTTHYRTMESILPPKGSCQFSGVSPVNGYVLNRLAGGSVPVPGGGTVGQPLGMPTGRDWNQLQGSELFGAPEEDPAEGYYGLEDGFSHNIAHSARYHSSREAYLFALDFLGYDLCMGFASLCASHHMTYETAQPIENWVFTRPQNSLLAWGAKDIGITIDGQDPKNRGAIYARRLAFNGIGPLNFTTGSFTTDNKGVRTVGYVTNRVLAWSLSWQACGVGMGGNEFRTRLLTNYDPFGDGFEHSPFRLWAKAADTWGTYNGYVSQNWENISGGTAYHDYAYGPGGVLEPGGATPTDIATRLGGEPYGGAEPIRVDSNNPSSAILADPDTEWWSTSIDFHQDYLVFATDAVAGILDDRGETAEIAMLHPVLTHTYWNYLGVGNFTGPDGFIGIPTYHGTSKGTDGPGQLDNTAAILCDPPVSPGDFAAGEMFWYKSEYRNYGGPSSTIKSREYQNHSMGVLSTLRWGTLAEKTSLLQRFGQSLFGSANTNPSTQQIIDRLRQVDGYVASGAGQGDRAYPFIAEALRHA